MSNSILLIVIAAAVVAGGYLLWSLTNSFGFQKRTEQTAPGPKKPTQGRATDRMRLTPQEQRLVDRAREMAKQGQVRAASQLLEQSGLQRECIELLEQAGLIDDAAGILIKMQRQNRAGYVYARHSRWLQAAECFKAAGLTLEAAKCLREAERYEDAAKLYTAAGKLEDAAACFTFLMRWLEAGRIFMKLGQIDKARNAYEKHFKSTSNRDHSEFSEAEIGLFQDAVVQGMLSLGFIDILARAGKLVDVVRGLISEGKIRDAATIYTKSIIDLGPLLMSEVNLQSGEGRKLAEMLLSIKNFRYAGMVYEQMGEYKLAGKAFEETEDKERASYCYERGGDKIKARALRSGEVEVPQVKSDEPRREFSNDTNSIADLTTSMDSVAKRPVAQSDVPAKNLPAEVPTSRPTSAPKNITLKVGAGVFSLDPLSQAQQSPLDADRLLFHKCALFQDLDHQQRTRIWEIGALEHIAQGHTLVNWSEDPRGLYYILEGEMDCILNSDAGDVPLETLTAGEMFGEICLLAEQPASVKLVARSNARVLLIERDRFVAILDQDGTLARKVYKHFTHHLLRKLLNPSKSQDLRHAS